MFFKNSLLRIVAVALLVVSTADRCHRAGPRGWVLGEWVFEKISGFGFGQQQSLGRIPWQAALATCGWPGGYQLARACCHAG